MKNMYGEFEASGLPIFFYFKMLKIKCHNATFYHQKIFMGHRQEQQSDLHQETTTKR